jgi:hypothetical protein
MAQQTHHLESTLEQIEAYWRNGRHWVVVPLVEKPAEPTGVAGR